MEEQKKNRFFSASSGGGDRASRRSAEAKSCNIQGRVSLRSAAAALALCIGFAVAADRLPIAVVDCWWDGGHMLVGAIAKLLLKQQEIAKLEAVLAMWEADYPGLSSLATAPVWADHIRCTNSSAKYCRGLKRLDSIELFDQWHWIELIHNPQDLPLSVQQKAAPFPSTGAVWATQSAIWSLTHKIPPRGSPEPRRGFEPQWQPPLLPEGVKEGERLGDEETKQQQEQPFAALSADKRDEVTLRPPHEQRSDVREDKFNEQTQHKRHDEVGDKDGDLSRDSNNIHSEAPSSASSNGNDGRDKTEAVKDIEGDWHTDVNENTNSLKRRLAIESAAEQRHIHTEWSGDIHGSRMSLNLELRLVLHILGDLHQPLHAVECVSKLFRGGDSGGSKIEVELKDKMGDEIRNLHQLWDSMVATYTHSWPDLTEVEVLKQAQHLLDLYPREELFDDDEDEEKVDVMKIALESHKIAIEKVYAEFDWRTLDDSNSFLPYRPSAEYLADSAVVAEKQVLRGGYRLARILRRIASHLPPLPDVRHSDLYAASFYSFPGVGNPPPENDNELFGGIHKRMLKWINPGGQETGGGTGTKRGGDDGATQERELPFLDGLLSHVASMIWLLGNASLLSFVTGTAVGFVVCFFVWRNQKPHAVVVAPVGETPSQYYELR